jgi:hypothetical protein
VSRKLYPRIGVQRFRGQRWDKQRRQHPNDKNLIRPCVVCGLPSSHEVFIEVNWFRGDDEGPYRTCRDHRNDLDAILTADTKAVAKATGEPT